MVTLDKQIDFVEPDRLRFTQAAHVYIEKQRSFVQQELPDTEQIVVLNLGVDGPWIAFSSRHELSTAASSFISDDGVLASMPLRVDGDDVLVIDVFGDRLRLPEVDLDKLIPASLRQAFADKLGTSEP